MSVFHKLVAIVGLLLTVHTANAKVFEYSDVTRTPFIGSYVDVLEDPTNSLTINQVKNSAAFTPSKDKVPNFGITKSGYWLRIRIKNETQLHGILLALEYPSIDQVSFFTPVSDTSYSKYVTGEEIPVNERAYPHQSFVFALDIPQGQTKTYYLKVKSTEQILMPLVVGSEEQLLKRFNTQDILSSLYMGIILVMILYNIFIYFTVRDKSYLYYVLYILFVGLTQLAFMGYTYRFFWPNAPWLSNQSVILFPALTGIAAIEFLKTFLQVKTVSKKFIWILNALNIFYIVNCVLSIAGQHQLSQQLLQPNAMIASLVIVYIAIYILRKGNRSAGFFLLAWVTFLVGIIVFIMKDIGVIPYNNFTTYILQIGSAIEVVVLSFALADKINIFRKEKEASQALALEAAEENAKIVSEQNVMLENKVNERTLELRASNDELNKTLRDLKEAEAQLVESEKMASLGQLTAGIAHEINNPINFVTSNVNPLKRDVEILLDVVNTIENIGMSDGSLQDKQKQIDEFKEEVDFDYLKVEINHLLKGINEGASRTAEIVKGLRIFSRLDEDDLKKADINEGLESTLVIVNNLMNGKIKLIKEYGNIPLIECYPGKLNQVFLNIIGNAIHAIHKRHNGEPTGVLKISTSHNEKSVFVKIEDNGTGMDETTKKKIFEPFFTTKDVGEGTGLGMSIAYNTIKKHNGQIYVNSTLGIGTEFILDIPIIHELS